MQQMALPHGVLNIMSRLTAAGHHVYVVGGSLRDALRGVTPHDYDMTTDATPAEMKRIFHDHPVIETGIRHGTLTILSDGTPYEVTTFRIDGDYLDHRHPDDVTFTRSLTEDLARRDFTINAIAYHPDEGCIDPHDGCGDIERGLIRAVGDPSRRFEEDALRILRALRFSAVLGYTITAETAHAAGEKKHLLTHVSRERVREEICKLIVGDHASHVIRTYPDILSVCLPLKLCEDALHTLSHIPADAVLRLTALLSPAIDTPAQMDAVMRDLKFDNASRLRAVNLIAYRTIPLTPTRREVLGLLVKLGPDALDDLCVLRDAPATRTLAAQLISEGAPYRITDLAVSGSDILAATPLRGPAVGDALSALLFAVINERVENTRDALLAYLHATL